MTKAELTRLLYRHGSYATVAKALTTCLECGKHGRMNGDGVCQDCRQGRDEDMDNHYRTTEGT